MLGADKEQFPISIVGTSTAVLDIFSFADGAILQQLSSLMPTSRFLESNQGVWLFLLICMVIAPATAFLSKEMEPAWDRTMYLEPVLE